MNYKKLNLFLKFNISEIIETNFLVHFKKTVVLTIYFFLKAIELIDHYGHIFFRRGWMEYNLL